MGTAVTDTHLSTVSGVSEEPEETKKDGLPNEKELLAITSRFLREAQPFSEELKRRQEINKRYYLGDQTERNRVTRNFSNAVYNKIFEAIETIVPIVTSQLAEFVVSPAEENEVSEKKSDQVEKTLAGHFQNLKVSAKLEKMVRQTLINVYGVWKIVWDKNLSGDGDVNIINLEPGKILFPRFGGTVREMPFIIERHLFTFEQLEQEFDSVAVEQAKKSFISEAASDDERLGEMKRLREVLEIWTNEWRVFQIGENILRKEKNPYWNWENENLNFIENSSKPYIFLSPYGMENQIVGSTSQIEQSIPIQDVINICARTIINHVKKMGNGTWLIDSDTMSEEEARSKITNASGLIIHGKGVADQSKIRRDAPPPLPTTIENLMIRAEAIMDNLWGVHSTTRGERGQQETLGGRQLLKQADVGRLDLLVREIEKVIEETAVWLTQLMKLFYDRPHVIKFVGESGVVEFENFKKDSIERDARIIVKSGTTLPTDHVTKRNEAIALWSAQAIDPVTLFEMLKFPKPEESAQRLLLWRQGQLPTTPLTTAPEAVPLAPETLSTPQMVE